LGLTVLILGLTALCLGLVAMHALIAENQFKLDRLQDQATVVQARYEKLRLQVAQLEAPDRIVAVAEGRLGMRQPGSVTYLPAPGTSLPASGPASQTGRSDPASTARAGIAGTVEAPQGEADWPTIKPDMGSSP
jgi:cell division protein FtsL